MYFHQVAKEHLQHKFFDRIKDVRNYLNTESVKKKIIGITSCEYIENIDTIVFIILLKANNKTKTILPVKITYIMSGLMRAFIFKKLSAEILLNRFKSMITKYSKKISKNKKSFYNDDEDLILLDIKYISYIDSFNDSDLYYGEMKDIIFSIEGTTDTFNVIIPLKDFSNLERFLVERKRFDLIL